MKKSFQYLHRYLGLMLSVLFVVWFLSGFVMMFHSFPRPLKSEYLKLNQPIGHFDSLPLGDSATALSLETCLERLYLRRVDGDGQEQLLAYPSWQPISGFPEAECRQLALARCPEGVDSVQTLTHFDMWIPWERYAEYFPIYKYHMDDDVQTELYVSSVTGEIVQESTHVKRLAAWFGAIPHWVYIKHLRLNAGLWKNTVIVLSALGSLMCLAGIILGFHYLLRMRRRKSAGFNPYKKFWMKWHYGLGLFFGLVTFTYVFSGMMSLCSVPQFVAPGNGRRPMVKSKDKEMVCLPLESFSRPVDSIVAYFPDAIKVEWTIIGSEPFYRVTQDDGSVVMAQGDSSKTVRKLFFEPSEVEKIFAKEIGRYPHQIVLQGEYDNYYRPNSKGDKVLPVYRIDVKNPQHTAIYVDPATASKVGEFTSNSRVHRWVYQFLHAFDTPWLLSHPTIRLFLELFLMVGGTLLSVTALGLTWKRIFGK